MLFMLLSLGFSHWKDSMVVIEIQLLINAIFFLGTKAMLYEMQPRSFSFSVFLFSFFVILLGMGNYIFY